VLVISITVSTMKTIPKGRALKPKDLGFSPLAWLATVGPAGLSPVAPGTVGTVFGVGVWWLLVQWDSWFLYILATIVITVVGTWASDVTSKRLGVHDHSGIVIDEVAGFLITMLFIPVTWWSVLIGFGLFRFFDIVKPQPIKWLDQKVSGGIGIMVDDVLAGIYAWLCLAAICWLVI
jgi:phosphatidylglycerophosphatase A